MVAKWSLYHLINLKSWPTILNNIFTAVGSHGVFLPFVSGFSGIQWVADIGQPDSKNTWICLSDKDQTVDLISFATSLLQY